MRIYLLTRKDETCWDEYEGFVLAAMSGGDARRMAQAYAIKETLHRARGHETYAVGGVGPVSFWDDSDQTECVMLAEEIFRPRDPGVILASYNAG